MHQVENGKYNPNQWYENILSISRLPPLQRYNRLTKLHDETLADYITDLNSMTPEEAEIISSDARPRKIVVAHIMAWEDFQTQVFKDTDPLARLQLQLNFQGYIDPDSGIRVDFNNGENNHFQSVDDFNAYQADKYKGWAWSAIKQRAISTAQRLRGCFPDEPSEDLLQTFEDSPPKKWKLTKDSGVTLPSFYYLWMVSLKHEAIEHRQDIAIVG